MMWQMYLNKFKLGLFALACDTDRNKSINCVHSLFIGSIGCLCLPNVNTANTHMLIPLELFALDVVRANSVILIFRNVYKSQVANWSDSIIFSRSHFNYTWGNDDGFDYRILLEQNGAHVIHSQHPYYIPCGISRPLNKHRNYPSGMRFYIYLFFPLAHPTQILSIFFPIHWCNTYWKMY